MVAQAGRSTTVSTLDARHVQDARDVVGAMHEVAVRQAVGHLTAEDLDAMRAANARFDAAVQSGDIGAAIAADDELHAIPIAVAGNRAVAVVLEQFTPVVRRAERLRFSSMDGRASVVRHEELIDLCAAGDADGAAAIAFDIWHTLPTSKE